MDDFTRCFESSQERSRNILDVNDRTPGRAITLNVNPPGGEGPRDQVIKNEIESQARGYSVGGGVAKTSGTESRVRKIGEVSFNQNLGCAIRCDRVEFSGLVKDLVAGGAIGAARGGEDEALHAHLLRALRQMY